MGKQILKTETRFAVHLPANDRREDSHYVKEQITYDDGTIGSKTSIITNYERPVWVTTASASLRNYKEKKEFAPFSELTGKKCTESDLNKTAAMMLGKPWAARNRDELKADPYLYGYDIPSTSFIKLKSLKANDFSQSPYTYATFDIETTTTDPKQLLMATFTMRDGDRTFVHTAIIDTFFGSTKNPTSRIEMAIKEYLPQYSDKLNLMVTYHATVPELIKDIFKTANERAPDFLGIWNMDFDLGVIIRELEDRNLYLTDYLCDQKVPWKSRHCKYKRGQTKKVTASGVVKPINPSLQWHSLQSTSSFFVIDAMCTYRQLRLATAEEPSYSLDAILQKELGSRKLKFEAADKYKGEKWHNFMTANYPAEYVVYNIYDCIAMLELEEKLKDITMALPEYAGISDFARFNSQSRKLTDALFVFGLSKGVVIGTASNTKEVVEIDDDLLSDEDDDDETLDPNKFKTLALDGWIQLLPQNLLLNEGLQIFTDFPFLVTKLRGLGCDFDSVSSYPSCLQVGNVSKETCLNEIITITGLREVVFREQNLSVMVGDTNLLEYFSVMFELPDLTELDRIIAEEYPVNYPSLTKGACEE